MAGRYSRDVRGRFTKMGDSIEDIENTPAADVRPGMEVPRYSLAGDVLAQGGESSPLRSRNPTLVHADEISSDPREARNSVLRSAARDPRPMDPSYELVSGFGAETQGTRRVRAEGNSHGR